MGYTISIHLTPDAPIDQITDFLKNSKAVQRNPSIWISNTPSEHGYSNKSPSGFGIYVSYSYLMLPESYFIHTLLKFAAVQYCLRSRSHKAKKDLPYYLHDSTVVHIFSEAQFGKLTGNRLNYKMFDGKVIRDKNTDFDDERDFEYFDCTQYDESSKDNSLWLSLKIFKFLSGETKRLKLAEKDFHRIKKQLLENYQSTTTITEIY